LLGPRWIGAEDCYPTSARFPGGSEAGSYFRLAWATANRALPAPRSAATRSNEAARHPLHDKPLQTASKSPGANGGAFCLHGDTCPALEKLSARGRSIKPSPSRGEGRSFVDLERGIFYRLAEGATRLLTHMRRWHAKGIVKDHTAT